MILVKPQFEVGHRDASISKGVIKDPTLWSSVLLETAKQLERVGFRIEGLAPSKLRGAAGNQEFFFWASIAPGSALDSYSLTALIDSAVAAVADPP